MTEWERQNEADRRRRETPCYFEDGITEEEFEKMALRIAKRIKRIKAIRVFGPVIIGTAWTQSGISTWNFRIDFNDFGHITGKYWISSGNKESNIPRSFAEQMREQLIDVVRVPPRNEPETKSTSNNTVVHEEKHAKSRCLPKLIFTVVLAVAAFLFIWEEKPICVGASAEELLGKNYEVVVSTLEEAGLKNIDLDDVADLDGQTLWMEDTVCSVAIGGRTDFSATSKFPRDAKVTVQFHVAKLIPLPLASKEATGMNYKDVVAAFKEAGFVNVETVAEHDIITGWLTDDGEVKQVTVNEGKKFEAGTEYRPDASVVITYHTFREK